MTPHAHTRLKHPVRRHLADIATHLRNAEVSAEAVRDQLSGPAGAEAERLAADIRRLLGRAKKAMA